MLSITLAVTSPRVIIYYHPYKKRKGTTSAYKCFIGRVVPFQYYALPRVVRTCYQQSRLARTDSRSCGFRFQAAASGPVLRRPQHTAPRHSHRRDGALSHRARRDCALGCPFRRCIRPGRASCNAAPWRRAYRGGVWAHDDGDASGAPRGARRARRGDPRGDGDAAICLRCGEPYSCIHRVSRVYSLSLARLASQMS